MFPDNLTRAETRARAALIDTDSYQVTIDLTGRGVADPTSQFLSTSAVSFTAGRPGRLHIDLIADTVTSASLDGSDLDPQSFAASRLPLDVAPGEHRLVVSARCRYSRGGKGLHRFVDPHDDRVYLYTHFEPADARRMFACFDQPDLKAQFGISVLAPAGWLVVSNGAKVVTTDLEPGVVRWDFCDTARISTYLTAIAAGQYHRVDRHAPVGEGLPMSILCRQSVQDHLDADRIFATTTDGFAVFERHFGYPYPFGKYDQVFVPEFNGGAMENVGCVTFRDEYLFRSRVTAAAHQVRDDTILHELSHMWFGDLVTMRWWDDLWLKESFATWASHFCVGETAEDPTATWAAFCKGMKTAAYRQDQLPSTHPVAADMVDLEAAEFNFDGITYAKGASVLVQLVAFVGQEAFLRGLRHYFADHAYGTTELADLLRSLEWASGRDLSGWSAEWLETSGVNTLRPSIELDESGAIQNFVVLQSAPAAWPTLRTHRIAIGLYERAADRLVRSRQVHLDIRGPETPVPELSGLHQPDLVLVNDDDLSYAKVRLDPRSLHTVLGSIDRLPTALSRAVCWAAAWDMCRDAELPAAEFVALVLRGVGVESSLVAVTAVLAEGLKAAVDYVAPDSREVVLRRWQDGLGALLASAEPGSDHQLALAKAYLSAAGAEQANRLVGWLNQHGVPPGLVIDQELRWQVVNHLARLGRLEEAEIDAELARDHTSTGAEQAAAAKAARPTAAAKAAAWRAAVKEDRIANTMQRAICRAFWARDQDRVLAPYVDRYFETAADISVLRGVWANKGLALRTNVLRDMFPWPRDLGAFLPRLDAWLAGADLAESVRRVIDERRDDAVRAVRCQQAATRG